MENIQKFLPSATYLQIFELVGRLFDKYKKALILKLILLPTETRSHFINSNQ